MISEYPFPVHEAGHYSTYIGKWFFRFLENQEKWFVHPETNYLVIFFKSSINFRSSGLTLRLVEMFCPSGVVILISRIVPSLKTLLFTAACRNIGNFGWEAVNFSHEFFKRNIIAGLIIGIFLVFLLYIFVRNKILCSGYSDMRW